MITPADPDASAVYAAEDDVSAQIGPDLRSWPALRHWLAEVLSNDDVQEHFPTLPLDVELGRRSRTATASLASASRSAILIRDGSRDALTVLHELAHLIAASPEPHGADFRRTVCDLVRLTCGFEAFVALGAAYRAHGCDP